MVSVRPDDVVATSAGLLDLVIGAIAVTAMIAALRALFSLSDARFAACRRWAWRATVACLVVLGSPAGVVSPDATLMLLLGAVDCWLIALVATQSRLPQAVALRWRDEAGNGEH